NQTNYQTASRVAFNASGDAVVTWVDSSGLDGSGLGVYARRFSALGVAAAPFIVNLSTANDQTWPAVALADDGTATIVWHENSSGNNDVRLRRFGANGWASPEETIHAASGTAQTFAAVAQMPGRADVVAAWVSNSQDNIFDSSDGVYTRTLYFDGELKAGAETLLPPTAGIAQRTPAIAAAPDGTSVGVWLESRTSSTLKDNIFAQRYAADGTAIGSAITVNV